MISRVPTAARGLDPQAQRLAAPCPGLSGLTFRQPSAASMLQPYWSMRSCESVRPGPGRRRGLPRSHGPSEERIYEQEVNGRLTSPRAAALIEKPDAGIGPADDHARPRGCGRSPGKTNYAWIADDAPIPGRPNHARTAANGPSPGNTNDARAAENGPSPGRTDAARTADDAPSPRKRNDAQAADSGPSPGMTDDARIAEDQRQQVDQHGEREQRSPERRP